MKALTNLERETLQRLADEAGMKSVSEHTGLSKHALKKALQEGHEVPDDVQAAVVDYLKGRV